MLNEASSQDSFWPSLSTHEQAQAQATQPSAGS